MDRNRKSNLSLFASVIVLLSTICINLLVITYTDLEVIAVGDVLYDAMHSLVMLDLLSMLIAMEIVMLSIFHQRKIDQLKKKTVYISYNYADSAVAERIVCEIEDNVLMLKSDNIAIQSAEDIPYGDSILDSTYVYSKRIDVIIAIVTADYISSGQFAKEYNEAKTSGKRFVPVVIGFSECLELCKELKSLRSFKLEADKVYDSKTVKDYLAYQINLFTKNFVKQLMTGDTPTGKASTTGRSANGDTRSAPQRKKTLHSLVSAIMKGDTTVAANCTMLITKESDKTRPTEKKKGK